MSRIDHRYLQARFRLAAGIPLPPKCFRETSATDIRSRLRIGTALG